MDSTAICLGSLAGLGATCPVGSIGNPANAATAAYDSSQSLTGDDLSFGWNAGILYELGDNAQLGVAYRSSIKHKLEGTVDFNLSTELSTAIATMGAPYNTLFRNNNITATVELPESLSVSYARSMGDKLSILADVTWTRWSNFQELTIVFDPIQPASTIPENWDDSYRYSLGMNYKQDDKFTYRAGIAIDRTPIRSPEDRTPRIPGDDRTWLSFGIGYNMAADMSIDVGFSHLFVDDTPINNTDASFSHTVTGSYDADVNILSAQANFKF